MYGYDFFIAGTDKKDIDSEYLATLRDSFWDFVKTKKRADQSAENLVRNLKLLTAAHFFSIVPLHDDVKHQAAFLSMAELLMNEIEIK